MTDAIINVNGDSVQMLDIMLLHPVELRMLIKAFQDEPFVLSVQFGWNKIKNLPDI